jgi:hypothetical protein
VGGKPREIGEKMFLVAKRRQNGSPLSRCRIGRREREGGGREQMSAVSSQNPAFLSLAFACDVRLRDLSMASRCTGDEDHQKKKKDNV